MKHPVRDRLLMLLYALASFAAAAALIAFVFGQITPDMISGYTAQLHALPAKTVKIVLLVLSAVLVLLGLSLISAMFPPKKKRSSTFAIQQNENGTVRISLKTIDALVQKCLAQHSELKVVSSSLFSDEETVRIDVHVVLLSDISMPLAISALQKQITRYVEACSGVNVREVRVFVDGAMNGAEKAAESKYALPASVLCEEPLPVQPEEEAAAEEAPEAEMTVSEEAAETEEAPVIEEAPAAEEAAEPETEENPVQQEAPAAEEETAVASETAEEPAAEIQQETADEQIVSEKKKLFGLFSKK
ncbi:MAG: alkaline shock response membrane anchor protein AmaP [Clostridia bacterium]|nr:alkaline shock response membrane anchor protein AmaP [Clostridia bacterium]